jgi:hypothetical protein
MIFNQRHLLHPLREYETFYNTHRPQQVHARYLDAAGHDRDAGVGEDGVECGGVLGVPVADQVLHSAPRILDVHDEVPGGLGHPRGGRVRGRAEVRTLSHRAAGRPRQDRPEGVELADLFCLQARLRADALFAALWDNTDSLDVKVARRVLDGRYAFLEEGIVTPPTDRAWVAAWQSGPATVGDLRRRLPPSA